jgi:8-oxo-dGTP pyrophosphatase MutT (NUDIX family)
MQEKKKSLFKFAAPAILLAFRAYYYIFRPLGESVKIVIHHQGKVLLIRNSYGLQFWTLPGGGVKKNERLEEAAIRETREEVGIELLERDLTKCGSVQYFADYRRTTVWVFKAEVDNPSFHLPGVEVEEAKWFAKTALPFMRSHLLTRFLQLAK